MYEFDNRRRAPARDCSWDGLGHDFLSSNESATVKTSSGAGGNERQRDESCCRQCRARAGCTFWVRSTTNDHCWLKSSFSHFVPNSERRGHFLGPAPPMPSPPTPPPPSQVTVFRAGMANFSCFRIPSIAQTANGTLLAFAEARLDPRCADHSAAAIA
jgi:hypothetical protein